MSTAENDVRQRLRERLEQQSSNDPRKALRDRLSTETDQTTAFGTFMTRFLKGTGDALGATPDAAMDLLAMTEAGVKGVAGGLTPGGRGFEFGERYEEARPLWPQLPRPTVDETVAAGRAALAAVPGGETPSDAYRSSLEDAARLREQQEAEHPVASLGGDIGGSIAALLIGKTGLRDFIRKTEALLTRKPDLYFGARLPEVAPGVSRTVQSALNSNLARYGARGGFRAAETGLEAAYLEAISAAENDPMLAASLAAGGQVGASLSIEALKGAKNLIPGKPLLSLGVSALSAAGLWQMVKSASPGGRDRILESVESGYDKVTYALILGALGGAIGARGRDAKLYEDFLPVSEAMMTVPRGAVLSLLADFVDAPESEQNRFEETLNEMMAEPDFEGRDEFERDIVDRLRSAVEDEAVKVDGVYRGTIRR